MIHKYIVISHQPYAYQKYSIFNLVYTYVKLLFYQDSKNSSLYEDSKNSSLYEDSKNKSLYVLVFMFKRTCPFFSYHLWNQFLCGGEK